MSKFVRVRDEKTGAEYSTARVLPGHTRLDKPAVDRNGDVLPAKPRVRLGGAVKSAKADKPSNDIPVVESSKASQATTDKKE